jgi:glycosyltransferase involved in cell wall biosynthesis
MNIAVVHEWLVTYAGSERVVEQMLALYPEAQLYSLVAFLSEQQRHFIHHKSVTTSFLQQLPFARQHFRQYLPLMPLAIEQFDLSDYDLILSSSHAVAKGVITRADQLHISYVHTPMRYVWDMQQQYLKGTRLDRGLRGVLTQVILHYLRLWDLASADRVDCFVANSRYVARRIWKTYRRSADVIYPPVAVDRFLPQRQRDDFYLLISRFVPYKRVDLVVTAFNQLGLPLVVIGDGSDQVKLQEMAAANVQILPPQPEATIADYLSRCRAFVFAAAEDFGITLVEAQAAGAPVIAFGKGGATEIVIPGKTGLLFSAQTVESLIEAVQQFAVGSLLFEPEILRHNAERFSIDRFRHEFSRLLEQKWTDFQRRDDIE